MFKSKIVNSSLGLILGCFLLVSCSTKGPLFTEDSPSSFILSGSKYEVIIRDNREQTEDREILVPILTWPGDSDQVSPQNTAPLIESFHKVASKYIEPLGPSLLFEIVIAEGLQSFKNPGLGESEYVSFQLEMNVIDPKTKALRFSSSGLSWGHRWSLDASPNRINKMYIKAFEKALVQAFKSLKNNNTINRMEQS